MSFAPDTQRCPRALAAGIEPLHRTEHHWHLYRLTCVEYDAMLREQCGRCARCDQPTDRFHTDHDHGAWEAVRGLVCPKCNSRIAHVERGAKPLDVLTYRYLREAWWRTHRPHLAADVTAYAERYGRVAA